MAEDHPRIEELKRRVKNDPASLAFAHLAEEYRRAGRFAEAIDTCRAGLAVHPNYLSARVTLGRALIEHGDLDAAQAELQGVMTIAPDNLAAIRGLAEIHQRRGQNQEALDYYRWALEFAGQDPDLAKQVRDLAAAIEPQKTPGGESRQAAAPAPAATPAASGSQPAPSAVGAPEARPSAPPAVVTRAPAAAVPASAPADAGTPAPSAAPAASVAGVEPPAPAAALSATPVTPLAARPAAPAAADSYNTQRQLAVYKRLLDAILADRERRQAGR